MKPQAYLALLTMALTLALFSMTIVYAEDAQDDSSTDDILLNLEKIKKAHEYFRSYIDAQSSPQSLLGFQRGYAEKLDILPRELHQRLVEHHRQKVTEEYQGDFSDQLRPTLKGVIETKKQFGNDIRLLDNPRLEFFQVENKYLKDIKRDGREVSQIDFSVSFRTEEYPNIYKYEVPAFVPLLPPGTVISLPLKSNTGRPEDIDIQKIMEKKKEGKDLGITMLATVVKAKVSREINFTNDKVAITRRARIDYYIIDTRHEEWEWVADSLEDSLGNLGKARTFLFSDESQVRKHENEELTVPIEEILNHFINRSKVEPLTLSKEALLEKLESVEEKMRASMVLESDTPSLDNEESGGLNQSVVEIKSGGSGFYICKNLVLTNDHVVRDSQSGKVQRFVTVKKRYGDSFRGGVKSYDPRLDLALVEVEEPVDSPLSFYNEDSPLEENTRVSVVGYPNNFNITQGVISRLFHERAYAPPIRTIQTDAAINPGNSGGPLIQNGKVVGVNARKVVGERVESVGFAIDYREVLHFLEQQGVKMKEGVCQD